MANPTPLPAQDPIARPRNQNIPRGQKDPNEGQITLPWMQYFTANDQSIASSTSRVSSAVLNNQSALIATTSFPNQSLTAGIYRVSYYARITVADGVSSSLAVTFGFTDLGVTTSFVGAAITGDTTITVGSQSWIVYSDNASPITYAAAYASNTPGKMNYRLIVTLESLPS